MADKNSMLLDNPPRMDKSKSNTDSPSRSRTQIERHPQSTRTVIDVGSPISEEYAALEGYDVGEEKGSEQQTPQSRIARIAKLGKNLLLWPLKKPICQLIVANSIILGFMMTFLEGRNSDVYSPLTVSPIEQSESGRVGINSAKEEKTGLAYQGQISNPKLESGNPSPITHPQSVIPTSKEPLRASNLTEQKPTMEKSQSNKQEEKDFYNREGLYSQYISNADDLFKRKRYQDALLYYQKAADLYPSFQKGDWAHYQLGECYFAMKQFGKALASFRTVITKYFSSPYEAKARFKIGECLFAQNHYDRARKSFYTLIAQQAKYSPEDQKLIAEAYYRIADCYSADSARVANHGQIQNEISIADTTQNGNRSVMTSATEIHR